MKIFYIHLFTLLLATACSAQQKWITIGTGGGFSGNVDIYRIQDDGIVQKGSGIGEIKYVEQGKLKKANARACIKEVARQTLSLPDFTRPGNMYYFISYNEGDVERKVTWGDPANPAPQGILALYKEIQEQLKSVDFKPIQ